MANGVDHNPLTRDHLEKLNQLIQMTGETDRLLAKFKAAQIDVTQAELENKTQRELGQNLKRAFFPNEP